MSVRRSRRLREVFGGGAASLRAVTFLFICASVRRSQNKQSLVRQGLTRQRPTFLLDEPLLIPQSSAHYDAQLTRGAAIKRPFMWCPRWGLATMGLLLSPVIFAQLPARSGAPPAPVVGQAEVERVIVTGSNIPSAEETGPNPVDTYRPSDIEKLGIRNATDLQEFIPQDRKSVV